MNKILLSALVVTIASITSLQSAKADCTADTSPVVRTAIAYLSMVERGGIPPFGERQNQPNEEKELCQKLEGSVLALQDDGYTATTLMFQDRTCQFTIMVKDDRVGDMHWNGCTAN